ncbi:hypothetical protein DUNSADRAFT_13932 [Dunaliella salina]|uniref:Encoded protein n=1 Tax=Dunaliella salina TaxID=3046 RepID=A0ABQ7G8E8_DUNSA|nr:hypothetical protein DUNSADRAFT_13932 [Dunaliella salina]|eukprot:KAF5830872.1 hypothetical protein DUNSADRAFT_13932 [Dunaliella salina]
MALARVCVHAVCGSLSSGACSEDDGVHVLALFQPKDTTVRHSVQQRTSSLVKLVLKDLSLSSARSAAAVGTCLRQSCPRLRVLEIESDWSSTTLLDVSGFHIVGPMDSTPNDIHPLHHSFFLHAFGVGAAVQELRINGLVLKASHLAAISSMSSIQTLDISPVASPGHVIDLSPLALPGLVKLCIGGHRGTLVPVVKPIVNFGQCPQLQEFVLSRVVLILGTVSVLPISLRVIRVHQTLLSALFLLLLKIPVSLLSLRSIDIDHLHVDSFAGDPAFLGAQVASLLARMPPDLHLTVHTVKRGIRISETDCFDNDLNFWRPLIGSSLAHGVKGLHFDNDLIPFSQGQPQQVASIFPNIQEIVIRPDAFGESHELLPDLVVGLHHLQTVTLCLNTHQDSPWDLVPVVSQMRAVCEAQVGVEREREVEVRIRLMRYSDSEGEDAEDEESEEGEEDDALGHCIARGPAFFSGCCNGKKDELYLTNVADRHAVDAQCL